MTQKILRIGTLNARSIFKGFSKSTQREFTSFLRTKNLQLVLRKILLPIFCKEWKKHKAKAKVPDALATFTLPTKSFTQGVVAEAQDEIDAMMKKEGLSPKTAANWLISKLRSMKTPSKKAVEARAKARHALEKLAKEFIEPIKKETEASASSPSAGPSTMWYFPRYRAHCYSG